MNILFIGDIIGRPGRKAVKKIIPDLKKEFNLDLVIANGENLASGLGMTYETYREMIHSGIDYFTSGNDIWCKREFMPYLDEQKIKVLRPANYPPETPGRGQAFIKINHQKISLINLMGRVFINEQLENPFLALDQILEQNKKNKSQIIMVDFHAEATSEKNAFGYYADGRVSAVLGTHTHVPTADCRILPKGTAYITDIGMTGGLNSCIGADLKLVTKSFLTGLPLKIEPAKGMVTFNAVLLKINDQTAKVEDMQLINKIRE